MSNLTDRIKRLVSSAKKSHTYKIERAILRFTELMTGRMKALNVPPSSLAQKLDAKPPYVSKLLRGKTNFTLNSIIKIATALDAEFVFDLVPAESNRRWVSRSVGRQVVVHTDFDFLCFENKGLERVFAPAYPTKLVHLLYTTKAGLTPQVTNRIDACSNSPMPRVPNYV